MTREKALFETSDPAAEAEADARADSDVRHGRMISHDAVKRCLEEEKLTARMVWENVRGQLQLQKYMFQ